MSDDSMVDSVFEDDGSSDFVPEEAPKPKPKAAKKASPKKVKQTKLAAKPAAKGKKKAKPVSEDEMSDNGDPFDDDSVLSQTPPKKTQKQAPAKKGGSNPLADVENESFPLDGGESSSKEGKASEKYIELKHEEHILRRPDTYVGSIERTEQEMWVYNTEIEGMEYREISYVPGLYKIFDEVVVNAADNKQNDKNMDEIRVTYSRETGEISVWNNGKGIPIEWHDDLEMYIPQMIFGRMMTSSNYNDDNAKITGGRNGLGAKLCNVFSLEFTVETQDTRQKKRYKQTWSDNMSKVDKPKITAAKGDDYTKVSFKPDYARFGMEGMDDDFEAILKRRVYDLAGTTQVAVKLNGTRVAVRNFKKYMEMYTKAVRRERGDDNSKNDAIIICNPHPYWEIGFAVSDGSFKHVSFVNSIATTSGGTHVNYIADQIATKLAESLKRNKKGTASMLKPAQIRNYLFLFVNSKIVNPAFSSQTKEQLTTKHSQFGSKPVLDEAFLKKVLNSGVLDYLRKFADHKADLILKKSDGGRRSRMSNPKLTDANKAGTKDGYRCTLILTEGESAKGLAMAGRSVVGADLFGVYPLRGKMLNVRDASFDQISKNEEIQSIKNFMGLQHKKEYTDTRGLRYGHLMIMTDQDHDGSHIKGLLINFLQTQFPSLLKIPEFLIEFITPIVKLWKGDPKNPTKQISFFTLPEYDAWRENHGNERGWEHKYYKGLGTSSTEDAQVYFRDLDRHLKEFHVMQDQEAALIELAFSKKKIEERKEWLRQFKPGTYLDHSVEKITYTDFINRELILFSMADNIRSIPSVVDGMKPGQRKVLYTCLRRNIKKDVKVLELSGQVLSMTAYHHGDASMHQTIIGLAQDFVGSNNINVLEPSGNFGSRLRGGADASSARYIFTRLSPFARRIFHAQDDPLLTHSVDDGKVIEPEVYVPVVPMILINGADGIGTGWSSTIPNYNPEEIVDNLKRMMNGEEMKPMHPWFKGFKGESAAIGPDKYKFSGIVKQLSDKEVEVSELPIRMWTQDFINKLEEIIKGDKAPSFIKDYKDYNTHTEVKFILQLDEKNIKAPLTPEFLDEKFKMTKTVATSNMVAFNAEGRIQRYKNVEEIMEEFFALRLKFYERRKQHQLSQLQRDLDKLTNQARFVQMIIDGKLVVSKKKKNLLVVELKEKGFKPFPKVAEAAKAGETERVVEASEESSAEDQDDSQELAHAYDYLLGMAIWSLTQERVEKLRRQIGDKEVEIDALIKLSKEDIWLRDLDDFITEWRFQLQDTERRRRNYEKMGRRTSTKLATSGRAAGGKKRKAARDDDSADEDFAAPKAKKTTAKKAAEPKGGIMGFLNKSSKPVAAARVTEIDSDDEFDLEVMPKKSRAPAKISPKPKDEDEDIDMENSDDEIIPKKSRAAPKASKPKAAAAPKKGRAPAVAKSKPKDDDSDVLDDDDFMEITKAEAAKTAPQTGRASRKPTTKYALSDSDSDDFDDLLGDVGKMVKGIGGAPGGSTSDSRQLFSELSQPGSSTGLPTSSKASKFSNEFDADETDYSKLIPQNSPRRSLQVKPKDVKVSDDVELEDDEEPVKPTKGRATAKSKAAAPKATASKSRGRPKKDAVATTAASASLKQTTLSPAAKAYASKQAKTANKKKTLVDDSDDDIDAMANDILDSPAGARDEAPARTTARSNESRPSRRTATTKKSYVIADDDSDDGAGDGLDDSFDMS
ncbi:DNA topoisomerase, partial [Aspergillus cavernicola]